MRNVGSLHIRQTPTLDFRKKPKNNLEIEIPGEEVSQQSDSELYRENLELKQTIQRMMLHCSRIESKMFIMNDQLNTLTAIVQNQQ